MLDYAVQLEQADWQPWSARVPRLDIETHQVRGILRFSIYFLLSFFKLTTKRNQVGSPDVVIATVDTVRHEAVLRAW